LIEMGGVNFSAVTPDVRITHVVGHDENDVWPFISQEAKREGEKTEKRELKQTKNHFHGKVSHESSHKKTSIGRANFKRGDLVSI